MKVTVLVVTYNHENFIGHAIESVLMQATDFDYEVVIIEDCSTDHTRDIVIDFQKKHINKIRLVLTEKNKNYIRAAKQEFLHARGRYIALLDGDDYWTSPCKLQKQADFLDVHQECAICFHNTTIVYNDNSKKPSNSNPPDQKRISTLEDLLAGNFIPTCSVMFRSGLFESFPGWFDTVWSLDWPLHILNAQHGTIGYIDEVMGAYRQHGGGMWNRLTKIQKILRLLEFYEQMQINLNFSYAGAIKRAREGWGGTLLRETRASLQASDWKEVFRGALAVLRYYPEHVLTEFWPCYRPVQFHRYPIVYRLRNRLGRRAKQFWANRDYEGRYEGNVDKADSDTVEGWAWDANQPNSPIEVEIYEDKKLWATVPADRFRRDLIEQGKGNGYHAFQYLIPDQLRDGKSLRIHVHVAGSRFPLNRNPTEIK
jgi:glycosyltransferase involved in cell wall biosynthesis